jgi:hypothetical protein
MRLKPLYDGSTVKLPNSTGQLEDIGSLSSSASVARLVGVQAFIYEEEAGQISVRLERKGRGSEAGYWVAYKRHKGKLRKTYICEAYALDPHNLDQAAQRLLAEGREAPEKHDSEGDTQREK